MALLPIDGSSYTLGPQEHLAQLLHLIKTLRSGETRFASLLHAKILDSLPSMAVHLGLSVPLTSSPSGSSLPSMDRIIKVEPSPAGSSTSSPYDDSSTSIGGSSQFFGIHPPPVVHSVPGSPELPTIGGLVMPATSSSEMASAYPMHFADGRRQPY